MTETFDWLKPAPLWAADGSDIRGDLFTPALLAFTTDQFMDEFFKLTQSPDPNALQPALLSRSDSPNKLYQPAHSRYYLVSASLCCRQPGFPGRVVKRAAGDSIYFVLRKWVPSAAAGGWDEYGWVVDGTNKSWQRAQSADVLPNEERLPLLTTTTRDQRPLTFGYLPVSSRETYQATLPVPTPDPPCSPVEQCKENMLASFHENVTQSLGALLNPGPNGLDAAVVQEVSLFMLLDMVDYFASYLPNIAAWLNGTMSESSLSTCSADGKSFCERDLADYLSKITSTANPTPTLASALADVAKNADKIRALNGGDPLTLLYRMDSFHSSAYTWDASTLESKVSAALPDSDPTPQPASQPAEVAKLQSNAGEQFSVRCVYERDCDTPMPPERFISRSSTRFSLAGFFDGDAPARKINIALPTDISIAAMRKFAKGVGFTMSGAMRNKMAMVTGHEKDLLNNQQPGAEGGFTLGFICSFSIQIIFIVAFMLLLIFVLVLNIVFWWIAFFRICLPIPVPARKS